jgi:hypothetical protein
VKWLSGAERRRKELCHSDQLNNYSTKPTIEGAGVKLQRAFGFGKTKEFDPFLLLDDFRNDNPEDYLAGFPWHPHRGIETITYVLAGSVEHGDSLGNKGKMTAGDVQWMTAGSGILHQEMPKGDPTGPHARLPVVGEPALASLKMTDPRYQDIPSSAIPEVTDDDGTRVRVICGEFWGKKGPVEGVAADPNYLDISVLPGSGSGSRSRPRATPSPTCSPARERSATPRPARVLTEQVDNPMRRPSTTPAITRWCCSTAATRSRPGGRRGHPLPAGVGQADRGAGGVVRPDRDEHAGAATPGDGRTANRRVHQTSLNRR